MSFQLTSQGMGKLRSGRLCLLHLMAAITEYAGGRAWEISGGMLLSQAQKWHESSLIVFHWFEFVFNIRLGGVNSDCPEKRNEAVISLWFCRE